MRGFPMLLARGAFSLVAVCIGLALAAAAFAGEMPPHRAMANRGDLTRIAHSTWGLDAPVPMFAAQMHQESGWDVAALSQVGAVGMAQFMPSTATWWCNLMKLSPADCQPRNPIWAMRALIGYDQWLLQRVNGRSEYDQIWATLRSYNGGLGHWQNEARLARPAVDHISVDHACGRASRSSVHCTENLAYPDRILNRLQRLYSSWGRSVVPS